MCSAPLLKIQASSLPSPTPPVWLGAHTLGGLFHCLSQGDQFLFAHLDHSIWTYFLLLFYQLMCVLHLCVFKRQTRGYFTLNIQSPWHFALLRIFYKRTDEN